MILWWIWGDEWQDDECWDDNGNNLKNLKNINNLNNYDSNSEFYNQLNIHIKIGKYSFNPQKEKMS